MKEEFTSKSKADVHIKKMVEVKIISFSFIYNSNQGEKQLND